MTAPRNGAEGYRLSWSDAGKAALKQLHNSIADPEARRRFREALRAILLRLQKDPLGFGEHQYRLKGKSGTVRKGAVNPLVVRYAVYDEEPLVYLAEFFLLPGTHY